MKGRARGGGGSPDVKYATIAWCHNAASWEILRTFSESEKKILIIILAGVNGFKIKEVMERTYKAQFSSRVSITESNVHNRDINFVLESDVMSRES